MKYINQAFYDASGLSISRIVWPAVWGCYLVILKVPDGKWLVNGYEDGPVLKRDSYFSVHDKSITSFLPGLN